MLEYKCDFCDKVVSRQKGHVFLGDSEEEPKPYWSASATTSFHGDRRYGVLVEPGSEMIICEECIERIKNTPEAQRKGDEIIIGAMILTGKFKKKTDPFVGQSFPSGEDEEKQDFKRILLNLVDTIPDGKLAGLKERVQKIQKIGLQKLSEEFFSFIDKRFDEIEKNAGEPEG